MKLLQTTTIELRQILVFIWTKILALDKVHAVSYVSACSFLVIPLLLPFGDALLT